MRKIISIKKKQIVVAIFVATMVVMMIPSAINPVHAALIDNGDGTMTDDDIDIMWLKSDIAEAKTWDQAMAWAQGLVFAGHDDWRLPSAKDFSTGLPDTAWNSRNNEFGHLYGKEWGDPANSRDILPMICRSLYYWTNTVDPTDSSNAYCFFASFDGVWLNSETSKATALGVIAVRAVTLTPPRPLTWTIEPVDPTANVGGFSSLALDSAGNPHISYYDATNKALKYAVKVGGAWNRVTVDSAGSTPNLFVGQYSSLALDSNGNPHIGYTSTKIVWRGNPPFQWSEEIVTLKYAVKVGGVWNPATVDPEGGGKYLSLALDSGGNPRISYYNNTVGLKYATKVGGVWNCKAVHAEYGGTWGYYSSMALDSAGNPHISCTSYTYSSLFGGSWGLIYAKRVGSAWNIEAVHNQEDSRPFTNGPGGETSIDLDSAGNPHISYYYNGFSDSKLRHARKIAGAWRLDTIDGPGADSSIALDSNGNPHISYTGERPNIDQKLYYARKVGGAWGIQIVDSTAGCGRFSSLALDSAGNPHISYCNGTNGLKHAFVRPTSVLVHLESIQDNGVTSDLGKTTFGGITYLLPKDVSKSPGSYQAQYAASSSTYSFDSWVTSGGISVPNKYNNPTTVVVSGAGTLRAKYKTTIFSDGFESGSFKSWTGTTVSAGETATVVTTLKHHGTYGARFTSNGAGGTEYSYCYKAISSSSELYASAYFRVSQSGIVDENDRVYLMTLSGSSDVAYAGWRKTGGVIKWTLGIRNGTVTEFAYSSVSPSLNQWYCVELHWKKSSTAGLGELYVNGGRVCSLTGKNTAAYGSVSKACFGLPGLYYCAATTAYCDCLKVARTYVGPEFIFSDGFESGSFSAWTGKSNSAGESAAVISSVAHHGNHSARLNSNGNGGFEWASCYKSVSSLTEVYARGYFRVAASGIVDNGDRISFIAFANASGSYAAYAGWSKTGGVIKWFIVLGSNIVYSTASPSLNTWYCVELHWKKGTTTGLGELYVNGVKVCSITGKNTAPYGSVSQSIFGLALLNCASATAYCDCTKIATNYIGREY